MSETSEILSSFKESLEKSTQRQSFYGILWNILKMNKEKNIETSKSNYLGIIGS